MAHYEGYGKYGHQFSLAEEIRGCEQPTLSELSDRVIVKTEEMAKEAGYELLPIPARVTIERRFSGDATCSNDELTIKVILCIRLEHTVLVV